MTGSAPMSKHHPTISAWQRDAHRGFYEALLHDWKLSVVWQPNAPSVRGAFRWEAEREGEKKRVSEETYEELEEAMVEAERFARLDAARRTAAIAAVTSVVSP
jgi:hypothetical protein